MSNAAYRYLSSSLPAFEGAVCAVLALVWHACMLLNVIDFAKCLQFLTLDAGRMPWTLEKLNK